VSARGVFVTGTDTDVGKTFVAVALVRSLVAAGYRVAAMKPVAAGIARGESVNADVALLAAAANVAAAPNDANPYAFAPAVAPHIAAERAGVAIDVEHCAAAYRRLAAGADAVVVEGAGGALVPLGPGTDMLDLAAALGLPVLLVVGLRLGCINHALLTALAVRARGLHLAGWIVNRIDPAMAEADANVAALASRLEAPLVADIGWLDPASPAPRIDGLPVLLGLA
jgi:dethiobiotin synthetase